LKAHWNDAAFQDDLLLLKEQVSYVHTDFEIIRSLLCLATVGYYICHQHFWYVEYPVSILTCVVLFIITLF